MGDLQSFRAPGAGREQAGPDHIRALLQLLRLNWLLQRFPPRLVRALYVFVNSFLTIGALALLALVSRNPFVFPSLGPTAYLLFFSPLSKASSPRNTIFGHAIGLICGYGAFVVTGAEALPFGAHPGISGHESWRRLSRWRPRGHAWSYSKSAIRQPEPRR